MVPSSPNASVWPAGTCRSGVSQSHRCRIAPLPAAMLLIPVAIAIRSNSAGSVSFSQSRVGIRGTQFRMYKLRTMVPKAEEALRNLINCDPDAAREWDRYGRLEKDPRIAGTFARIARRWSIDELPQLLNVLRGEIALVGPRPILAEQFARLPEAQRSERASVLPGMTGLWQIVGRSEMTLRQMVRFDLVYVRRRNALLDAYILAKTPLAVLGARGAYRAKSHLAV